MCGYACMNCGRCGKKPARPHANIESVPGYCKACGALNGPTAVRCKACGADLAPSGRTHRAAEP